jgi:hypothetical protein
VLFGQLIRTLSIFLPMAFTNGAQEEEGRPLVVGVHEDWDLYLPKSSLFISTTRLLRHFHRCLIQLLEIPKSKQMGPLVNRIFETREESLPAFACCCKILIIFLIKFLFKANVIFVHMPVVLWFLCLL